MKNPHIHFIKQCWQCEAIIAQCRCASRIKEVVGGICQDCIKKAQSKDEDD